ncbi:MAG TPA: hypothetical protein VIF62_27620 [Labilithrix sp.]|jgi:hypothetical protein
MRRSVRIALVGFVCASCGGAREPAAAPAPSSPADSSPPASAASAAPSSEPALPPRNRKPFEVYSLCSDVVTVVFGEDPKAANAGNRTIAPSSSIEGPRDPEGNQTVWLLDNAGAPLIKVHVTRGMKRVEIGRSCRTIDAR